MSDPIGYWMGEPISEMTREQLLEVVKALGRMDRQKDAEHDRHVAMLREISVPPPSFMQLLGRRLAGRWGAQ